MSSNELQAVCQIVIERAQRQKSILPREVREELAKAGLEESHWKDVLQLAQASLAFRKGRYYYVSPLTARMHHDRQNKAQINRAVRKLIRQYKAITSGMERREHRRIHFIHPIRVFTSDHRELSLMSQDISLTGLRIIGTCELKGQKVRVLLSSPDKGLGPWSFQLQILWSARAGDGLIENGGIFLGIVTDQT